MSIYLYGYKLKSVQATILKLNYISLEVHNQVTKVAIRLFVGNHVSYRILLMCICQIQVTGQCFSLLVTVVLIYVNRVWRMRIHIIQGI